MAAEYTLIAVACERAAVSVSALATAIGINEASCWDLMTYEDELSCLSLRQWMLAATALRVDPRSLLAQPVSPATEHKNFAELSDEIFRYCANQKISIDHFGDLAGRDVRNFVEKPSTALDSWNFDSLRDVCGVLGLHWPSFIPRTEFGPRS